MTEVVAAIAPRNRMRWLKWVLIAVGIPAVAICAYFLAFGGGSAMGLLQSRWIAKRAPMVKVLPVDLPDRSADNSPGQTFKYFGYEFQIPWGDPIDSSRTKSGNGLVAFYLSSGRYIVFKSIEAREWQRSADNGAIS